MRRTLYTTRNVKPAKVMPAIYLTNPAILYAL